MRFVFILIFLGLAMTELISDEGMWTFDNFPFEKVNKKYGFKITKSFLEKLKSSSVRFNDGGSGAFVSPEGLVITNHHVAMGQLQKMSSKKNDYVKNGFYAKSKKEEISCPDLEVNVLVSILDVTERVISSENGKNSDEQRAEARKAEISKIEKESFDKTGLRSDVVELYNGGIFHLYSYKKYQDVRLVMAPEFQAAAFGGDDDNFEFPRFAMDFAFFRVYEKSKPLQNNSYIPWAKKPVSDKELVFVSGHPGSTDRKKTIVELKYMRDDSFPFAIQSIQKKLQRVREYAKRGKEEERRSRDYVLGLENGLKAMSGELIGLKDPDIFSVLENKEKEFKKLILEKKGKEEFLLPFEKIASAQKKLSENKDRFRYQTYSGRLASIAITLVRYAEETSKPNEKRYEEFRESSLDSLKHRLLSPAPIHKDLEEFMFSFQFSESLSGLGKSNEYIILSLENKSPEERAKELISGTKLEDPSERKKLIESGKEGILSSNDPLIKWAISVDPILRKNRDFYENEIEVIFLEEGGKLARLGFEIFGKSQYPDATFTLRLSFGRVKGYLDLNTIQVPFQTTFYGLMDRAKSFSEKYPFVLSDKIKENSEKIELSKQLNFVSTNDITGGNSGSPVVNSQGQYVGIIFDGNAHSHVLSYVYDEKRARAVSVSAEGILEALKNIYNAKTIINEILKASN